MVTAMVRVVVLAVFLVGGCSGNNTKTNEDGGIIEDSAPPDTKSVDSSVPDEDAGVPEGGPADMAPDADTAPDAVSFFGELNMQYGDGIPAVKLKASPLDEIAAAVFVGSWYPVKIKEVRFIPASTYSGVLRIDSMQSGGTAVIGSKAFAVEAADVDKWYTVDFSELDVVASGNFYASISFDTISNQQEVIYGSTSSTGNLFYKTSGQTTLNETPFDPLMQVAVLSTKSTSTLAPPKSSGEICVLAAGCASGYCLDNRCVDSCTNTACSSGRCQEFLLGHKVCVTDCTKNADCNGVCIPFANSPLPLAEDFCVRSGPFNNGTSCQDAYHTVCMSGYCAACDGDSDCSAAGSCDFPPAPPVCNQVGPQMLTAMGHIGYGYDQTSLALDSSGNVHISFHDKRFGDLRYATNASGNWNITSVDESPSVGHESSLALDASGKVHISYHDYTNKDLKYATNSGGSWIATTVDASTDEVGMYTSLGVDSSGKVHISYYDGTNKDLKYATNAGGAWVATTIDSSAAVGLYTSLDVDAADAIHISYLDVADYNLKYATNATGSWVIAAIDSSDIVGEHSSLRLDAAGKVHISYIDWKNEVIKYANNVTGSWVFETFGSFNAIWGGYPSLDVDALGNAHISYFASPELKYATNASGAWVEKNVESSGAGGFTSLAWDTDGRVHISYHGDSSGTLKYVATCP